MVSFHHWLASRLSLRVYLQDDVASPVPLGLQPLLLPVDFWGESTSLGSAVSVVS